MITEYYVSYEVAKLLKEKGFDECIFEFYEGNKIKYARNGKGFKLSELPDIYYPHITHQMAMKWLREKHNIFIGIIPQEIKVGVDRLCYVIYRITEDVYTPLYNGYVNNLVDSYEETVETAIKCCLENLIQTTMEQQVKSYTDLSQSKILAEILSHDTADNTYERVAIAGANLDVPEELQYIHKGDMTFVYYSGVGIPCWSLAALLNYLREIDFFPSIEVDEHSVTMSVCYCDDEEGELLHPMHDITTEADNFVDACVELIIKLNEQKVL